MTGSLRDLIPDDHVLVKIDQVLDLGWLRADVADLYCADNGRPGIDPEAATRLMLAGFLLGIVHDRRLMREGQANLAIRWFIGYALHEALPNHSSLTRIRQRWGAGVFRRVFTRVVRQCQAAGLVSAETVHLDASIRRLTEKPPIWPASACRCPKRRRHNQGGKPLRNRPAPVQINRTTSLAPNPPITTTAATGSRSCRQAQRLAQGCHSLRPLPEGRPLGHRPRRNRHVLAMTRPRSPDPSKYSGSGPTNTAPSAAATG